MIPALQHRVEPGPDGCRPDRSATAPATGRAARLSVVLPQEGTAQDNAPDLSPAGLRLRGVGAGSVVQEGV
ncbi:MAG: hypothetical protein JXR77_06550 [Lentisphaeria bacterium]|nr:hypothetical protein [Lentisphaeria bacterium]